MTSYQNLIDVDELKQRLGQANRRVIDCRFDLMQPAKGRDEYSQGHIPGAQYAHLDDDLAGPVSDSTGRHPLPSADAFAITLGAWGIDNQSQVIVYDHASGAIAARLWWMLKWVGHEHVAVLNGGYSAWRQAGYEISDSQESATATKFRPSLHSDFVVSTEDLQDLVAAGDAPPIVDARDSARFAGLSEPIDAVAGHIPGAVNHPFSESISATGRWKSRNELRDDLARVLGADVSRSWVSMCGSGVTACHLALSAALAGYPLPRLYVGSWSEWIRNPQRPIATETE